MEFAECFLAVVLLESELSTFPKSSAQALVCVDVNKEMDDYCFLSLRFF